MCASIVVLPTYLSLTSQSILCDRGDPLVRQLGRVVSEVLGVVLPVVSHVSMYGIHVLVFLLCILLYCPCVGLSVVFIYFLQCCIIYLLYSLGDVFYFPALIVSY